MRFVGCLFSVATNCFGSSVISCSPKFAIIIRNGSSGGNSTTPETARHILLLCDFSSCYTMIKPFRFLETSTHVWVSGSNVTRFVTWTFGDSRFFLYINSCSSGTGAPDWRPDGLRMMGTVEPSSISILRRCGSIASTWRSKKSQPSITDVASFSVA